MKGRENYVKKEWMEIIIWNSKGDSRIKALEKVMGYRSLHVYW